jgi:hypothetical protein
MGFHVAAAVLALAGLMPAQTGVRAPTADVSTATLPVSNERIRAALRRPPPLLLSQKIQADFKIEILERQHFRDLLDLLDFSSGPLAPGGFYAYQQQQVTGRQTQPLFTVGLGGLAQSVTSAVSKARRERAERLAREEVRRALVEFCSAHECQAP